MPMTVNGNEVQKIKSELKQAIKVAKEKKSCELHTESPITLKDGSNKLPGIIKIDIKYKESFLNNIGQKLGCKRHGETEVKIKGDNGITYTKMKTKF